jgi:hypothetical protein
MTHLATRLRESIERHRRYAATKAEIERMPLDVALDLNIDRADAHRIATRAVYG